MIFCMIQRSAKKNRKKFIVVHNIWSSGPAPRYTHYSVWIQILQVWVWFWSFQLHLFLMFWYSCWLGYPGKQVACIMFTDWFFEVQQVAEYLIFATWRFLFLFTSHTNIIDILTALSGFSWSVLYHLMSTFKMHMWVGCFDSCKVCTLYENLAKMLHHDCLGNQIPWGKIMLYDLLMLREFP